MRKSLAPTDLSTPEAGPGPDLTEIFYGICDREGGAMELVRASIILGGHLDPSDEDTLRAVAADVRGAVADSPRRRTYEEGPAGCCVYMIRCGEYIKIGWTAVGAWARFTGMQNCHRQRNSLL